jgi:hypothetical protein
VLYVTSEFLTRSEQSNTPGEKNLGVAVIFMTFWFPMLISAAAGLLCLGVGALAFAYRRFFPPAAN